MITTHSFVIFALGLCSFLKVIYHPLNLANIDIDDGQCQRQDPLRKAVQPKLTGLNSSSRPNRRISARSLYLPSFFFTFLGAKTGLDDSPLSACSFGAL